MQSQSNNAIQSARVRSCQCQCSPSVPCREFLTGPGSPSKQAPRVVKIIGLWSVRMNRTFNGASCVEILKTNENNDLFNSVMWANGALCNLRPRVVRLAVQPLTAEMSEASLKRFLSRKWKEFMLAHSVDPGLCLDTCFVEMKKQSQVLRLWVLEIAREQMF